MEWIKITESAQIKELMEKSETQPIVVFKSSPTCHISKFALRNFEGEFANTTNATCYIVDVINNRLESMEIKEMLQVHHESPQLIIVSKGRAVFNTSHEGINAEETEKLLLRL